MPHFNHEIVLGSDSATFWTGTTWGDDPAQAQVFDLPREAWRAALDLATAQQAYLDKYRRGALCARSRERRAVCGDHDGFQQPAPSPA